MVHDTSVSWPDVLFLTGGNTENFVFDVYVCFVSYEFVSGQVLCFLDDLWFDDLCA